MQRADEVNIIVLRMALKLPLRWNLYPRICEFSFTFYDAINWLMTLTVKEFSIALVGGNH